MVDSCSNYLDVPIRLPLAYPPIFHSLALFGHPFVGDRTNFGLSES
jgi:hypothetical protein